MSLLLADRVTSVGVGGPPTFEQKDGDDRCVECPVRAAMRADLEWYRSGRADVNYQLARVAAEAGGLAYFASAPHLKQEDCQAVLADTYSSLCSGPIEVDRWKTRFVVLRRIGGKALACNGLFVAAKYRARYLGEIR